MKKKGLLIETNENEVRELKIKFNRYNELHNTKTVWRWFLHERLLNPKRMTWDIKYISDDLYEAWLYGLKIAEGTHDECKEALEKEGEYVY